MTTLSARPASGSRAARRAANSPWIDRLARLGLAARGLVYVLVGIIAVLIAAGDRSAQADRQGALHTLASQPLGRALVAVTALGFLGYCLWRVAETIWGHRDEDGAKRLAKRAGSAFRAVLYGSFTYSSARLAIGAGGTSGSDKTSKEWTARALGVPFGRTVVILVGVGFVVAGAALAWRGLRTKFEDKLKTNEMSHGMRRAVETVGLVGNVARGVVFAMVGVFLAQAAWTFDPHKARGLDGSLKVLADSGWGKVALVAVAAGMVAFGLYSFAEARYRRT